MCASSNCYADGISKKRGKGKGFLVLQVRMDVSVSGPPCPRSGQRGRVLLPLEMVAVGALWPLKCATPVGQLLLPHQLRIVVRDGTPDCRCSDMDICRCSPPPPPSISPAGWRNGCGLYSTAIGAFNQHMSDFSRNLRARWSERGSLCRRRI